MARTADTNFRPFLIRTGKRVRLTTEELYNLAETRNLSLTKNRTRDANRPSQFAWQHQLRRDQFALAAKGTYKRFSDGTWGTVATR